MLDNIFQSSPRVLVVDNEERILKLYKKLLEFWDYSVVVAEGAGYSLIDDAVKKARDSRCQIALVDMRLIDNFDEDDTSGLDLIEKIKPALTIVVSGYGTLKLALEVVKERGALDFFEKSDDPFMLKEMIEKVARVNCFSMGQMEVGPNKILETTINTLFDPAKDIPPEAHDQVLDLLQRLFPKAKKLRLEKMTSSTISSDFSTVPRPRSVILRVYEDELQPVIVKIARREKIEKEIERFNKHIKGRLVGKYNPVLESHVELWDIGGIKLSNVGTVEETFSNFVTIQPIEKIEQSLEHFFAQTWSDHYGRARNTSNTSLFTLYCDVWDKDWVQRASEFVLPVPSGEMSPDLYKRVGVHNPLDWLGSIVVNEGKETDPSLVEETRIAVTHGDLHADNLLIDDSQHGWVVDFERSGEGHALQDFIELESDIITRIACARENFPAFFHFCLTIVSTDKINDVPSGTPLLKDGETHKLLHTIAIIRRLAVQCTQINDSRQYLLGLYFNTIFRATITRRDHQQKSDLRTWMLASMLCRRLSHWNDPWPPEEWKSIS